MTTWQYILVATIVIVGVLVAYLMGRWHQKQKSFACIMAALSVDSIEAFFKAKGVGKEDEIESRIAVAEYATTLLKFFDKEGLI